MSPLVLLLRRFARHGGGATAIEYGLIAALLSLVVIASVNATGVSLYGTMNILVVKLSGH